MQEARIIRSLHSQCKALTAPDDFLCGETHEKARRKTLAPYNSIGKIRHI